ncbi:MAG TPA: tyrosine-type recombinase/integrase [Chitinophagales bacterium]|nr:tyrosine-type recombinase/integrase [Chitinophagales bacterium]
MDNQEKSKTPIPPRVLIDKQAIEIQLLAVIEKEIKGEKRANKFTQNLLKMFPYKEAQIYKGATEWYVEYFYQNPTNPAVYDRFKFRKGLNNSRIKKNTAERHALARAIQISINNLLANGFNPNERVTFDSLKEEDNAIKSLNFAFELKKAQTDKIRTVQSYSSAYKQFVAWLTLNEYDKLSIREITHEMCRQYFDYLVMDRKLANKTHNGQLSYIHAFFSELKARKIIKENPCSGITELKTKTGTKNVPMTDEEFKMYESELPGKHPRLFLFTYFIYYAFLREQETCDLRREQLDFANRIIHVQAGSAKNSRTVAVKMHEKLATELIKNRVDLLRPKQYIFSESRTLAPGATPLWRNRVSELWKSVFKEEIGIDKDMYALRHLSAKRFILNGGKAKHLQLLMRHSSLDMTEKYIGTLVPEDFGKIEDRIK